MQGLGKSFAYQHCEACGSLSQVDGPEDLAPYYAGGYYSMGVPPTLAPSLRRVALAQLVLGARIAPPAVSVKLGLPAVVGLLARVGASRHIRIADVGSGEGGLLQWLAACGFDELTGIDPFVGAEATRGSVQLLKASLSDVSRRFDFVMFNHSLEHTDDPARELALARELLEPGGHILVRVPVLGFPWRRYGTDWVGLDAPRHRFIADPDAVDILAERAGLVVGHRFFDSYELQFWGSELYRRGESLGAGSAGFPSGQLRSWRRWSKRLNRIGDGDSAGFLMSRRADA